MKTRIFSIVAVATLVSLAACGGDEGGETEQVTSDTTAIQGTDTVSQPVVVPATDSVVTTTTVTTDTMQGQVTDSAAVATDTAHKM
ncbi:MAG TPA: hypothetical protein VHG91_08690 [Longimicrobium sp.]|nr:hypothetical protein [Longimicrobium sp.]